jgi:hypothetical protein
MSVTAAVILAICLVLGFGVSHFSGKDDSLPEEIIEQIIEDQTGLDIDFTPSSEEG